MGQAVEIELSEGVDRLAAGPGLGLGTDLIAVLEATHLVGEMPATVRQADAEAWVAFENAAEDQAGAGDSRIERIADEVVEVVGPQARCDRVQGVEGVDEDECPERLGGLPEGLEGRIVE